MRPGLLAVGVAFVTLAGALTVAFYSLPGPSQQHDDTTSVPAVDTYPNATLSVLLTGTNASAGSFNVTWGSSGSVDAALYDVPGCASPSAGCPRSTAVASWSHATSGHYTVSGAIAFPYLLVWTDRSPRVVALWANSDDRQTVAVALPIMMQLMVDLSVVVLAASGALAIFLGLFLRADFRRPKEPPLAGKVLLETGVVLEATGPRTDSPPGEAGPLHPAPHARTG